MEIVITTIFPPTEGTRALAAGLQKSGSGHLWVVGDRKGPTTYDLPATRFLPIDAQAETGFLLAQSLNEGSYARKNLGYLLAIQNQASCIVETDDDNIPRSEFWQKRELTVEARSVRRKGWQNVYRSFSAARIWPRGFPLEFLQTSWGDDRFVEKSVSAGPAYIQQGLADENPDVDAVYRLTADLPLDFDDGPAIRLEAGAWCPFNSQNTTFFPPAYPLLYLPTHCSFRMTDIWRSFIAQRCLWAMDSALVFHRATVFQRRNEHLLLRDFQDEVSGYLQNERIRALLDGMPLRNGVDPETVEANLRSSYIALENAGIFPRAELALVEDWLSDLKRARTGASNGRG